MFVGNGGPFKAQWPCTWYDEQQTLPRHLERQANADSPHHDAIELPDDDPDEEVDDHGLAVVPVVAPPHVVVVPPMHPAQRPIDIMGVTVRFDNCSHASGIKRAWVRCCNEKHHRCTRYSQLRLGDDWRLRVAELVAWARMGHDIDKDSHIEPLFVATAPEVNTVIGAVPLIVV